MSGYLDSGIDFVGAGWAYPLGVDATGRIALVARDREIQESLRLILGTVPGERPMRPEFGCRIHEHVFGPANLTTAGRVAHDVREAIERWEPRVDLLDVGISFDSRTEGTMYVDIHYTLRGDNDPRNLVFPFYVIPDVPEGLPGPAPE
ncbi:GPW/gp25 family protein [Ornithinicoccus hortensis]|uniref:IraD/Gp25-like domain-containing protein n=1 Tax=Ornithinicoccus hortensis TaxID=82346 RepID=A0A542YUW3_9MICO|nr:GPW/gp25 family protein [Ornithinicoccus hortensis]TQL51878.1 hypothetical protein FB467_3045 [Ornithinicoccus hortensis]